MEDLLFAGSQWSDKSPSLHSGSIYNLGPLVPPMSHNQGFSNCLLLCLFSLNYTAHSLKAESTC